MKTSTLSHHKFIKLHRRLKHASRAYTAGTLELLWCHAYQSNPARIKKSDLEDICDWCGDDDVLVQALIDCELVDVIDDEHVAIHDWQEHAPSFVKRREYMREYMRGYNHNAKQKAQPAQDAKPAPKKKNVKALKAAFEVFWEQYPRKVGKTACEKKFIETVQLEQVPQIMDALTQQKKTAQWLKDGGQYIPHPHTWLNQGRYLDETQEVLGNEFAGENDVEF